MLAVTLPARDVRTAVEQIEVARRARATVAEVRFDRWAPEEIERAAELFPASLPLIATFRSADEGGDGPNDPTRRRPVLDRLGALPFAFVDFEIARDLVSSDSGSGGTSGAEPSRCILSRHWIGSAQLDRWKEAVRSPPDGGRFVKLVVPASLTELWSEVLPAVPAQPDPRLVLLTTGPSGPVFRAICARLGSPMTFAALPATADSKSSPVEPSQVPVDRLVQLGSSERPGRLFAVAGRPVSRSLSPALHHAWFRELRRAALYVPLEVATEEEFVDTIPRLEAVGFVGVNVTAPFKRAAREVATSESAAVEACGCANTLSLSDGEIAAENTDLAAVLRRFEELQKSGRWDGARLTVLGSGGAARATLAAARSRGCRATIVARDRPTAQGLADEFEAEPRSLPADELAPLVVNATTVGTHGTGSFDGPVESLLGVGTHVLDWVYQPVDPVLARLARERGASYEDGWRLFVYQAAESFGVWWDDGPSPESIANAVEGGPCAA